MSVIDGSEDPVDRVRPNHRGASYWSGMGFILLSTFVSLEYRKRARLDYLCHRTQQRLFEAFRQCIRANTVLYQFGRRTWRVA
jgi:hypothetical protein